MILSAAPPHVREGIAALRRLARQERYRAAFIFGSVARGAATAQSDLDARVIVDDDSPCSQINHPMIAGAKLDLTFLSFAQLRRDTAREIEAARRIPMIAESVILFDKDGDLARLQAEVATIAPRRSTPDDFHLLRFLIRHTYNKVANASERDPPTALLAMHLGLAEILDVERRLAGRWEVSSKRILPELGQREPELAAMIEQFVATAALPEKFALWQSLVARIARPLGIWNVAESSCDCATCRADLGALLEQPGDE